LASGKTKSPVASELSLQDAAGAKQHDGFQNGDKVRVVKAGGSTYGKEGGVSNPDWMGRVKIVVDGETKSYLPTELLLLESISATDNSTVDTSAVSAFIEHAKLQLRVEWKGQGSQKAALAQGKNAEKRAPFNHLKQASNAIKRESTAVRFIHQATMESAAGANNPGSGFAAGSFVRILKVGSQTRKQGRVLDGEFGGRVKVRMNDTGVVKSYVPSELETLNDADVDNPVGIMTPTDEATLEADSRPTQTLDNRHAVAAFAPFPTSTHRRELKSAAGSSQEVASPVDTKAVEQIVKRVVEQVVVRETTEVGIRLQTRLEEVQSAQLALSRQMEAVLNAVGAGKKGAALPPLEQSKSL
jgi:hypothetical protein